MLARGLGDCRDNLRNSQSVFLIVYAINEPKSVLGRDLGDCRDNLRNTQSVFLIVFNRKNPPEIPEDLYNKNFYSR